MEDDDVNLVDWVGSHIEIEGDVRRALAVLLLELNISPEVISRISGYTETEARDWHQIFQEHGVKGLLKSLADNQSDAFESEAVITNDVYKSEEFPAQVDSYEKADQLPTSVPEISVDVPDSLPDAVPEELYQEGALIIQTVPVPQPGGFWQDLDPPVSVDSVDSVKNEETQYVVGKSGWKMLGASRRGKMHAHQGSYREDAFAFDEIAGWNVVAVADGAGSAPLARVGSKVAVQAVLEGFQNAVNNVDSSADFSPQVALQSALKHAWSLIETEAQSRQVKMSDLASTLLVLALRTVENYDQLVVGQIGDGLLVSWDNVKGAHSLATPDQGRFAGETQFLTHVPIAELSSRVLLVERNELPQYYLIMTDGIGDDFYPPETYIFKLAEHLEHIVSLADHDEAKKELLELISYEKRASFDDRTLVVLYRYCFTNSQE